LRPRKGGRKKNKKTEAPAAPEPAGHQGSVVFFPAFTGNKGEKKERGKTLKAQGASLPFLDQKLRSGGKIRRAVFKLSVGRSLRITHCTVVSLIQKKIGTVHSLQMEGVILGGGRERKKGWEGEGNRTPVLAGWKKKT